MWNHIWPIFLTTSLCKINYKTCTNNIQQSLNTWSLLLIYGLHIYPVCHLLCTITAHHWTELCRIKYISFQTFVNNKHHNYPALHWRFRVTPELFTNVSIYLLNTMASTAVHLKTCPLYGTIKLRYLSPSSSSPPSSHTIIIKANNSFNSASA